MQMLQYLSTRILIIAMFLVFFPGPAFGQSTIDHQSLIGSDEATTGQPFGFGYGNLGPYVAEGNIWMFYFDGDNSVWRTKGVGEDDIWSEKSILFNENSGRHFNVAFDGEYFHFIHQVNPVDGWGDLEYIRGKPDTEGELTLDSPQVIYSDANWKVSGRHFTIITDDGRKPWVIAKIHNPGTNRYKPVALSSVADDGTWVDRPGFPKDLSAQTSNEIHGRGSNVLEIDEGKVLFTWRDHLSVYRMEARIWNYDPADPDGEGTMGDIENPLLSGESGRTSIVSPEPGIALVNSGTSVSRRNADGTWESVNPPSGLNEVWSNSLSEHGGTVRLWDYDGDNIRYRETTNNGTSWGSIVSKWGSPNPDFIVATHAQGSWASHHSIAWRSGDDPYDLYMGIDGTIPQPDAPQLVSPPDGTEDLTEIVTFEWGAVEHALTYNLQISTEADFSTTVEDISGITGVEYEVTELVLNLDYYWRVQAVTTDSVTGEWSQAWGFSTVGIPPAPALSSPEDGAEDQPTSLTFSWESSPGSEHYQLQIATVQDFSATFFDQDNITETEYFVDGFDTDRVYYWRVRAINEFGEGDWSVVWSYKTAIGVPAAPVLVTPENEATDQPVTLTLAWSETDLAATYRLQVSKESDFSSTVVNTGGITDTSFEASGLEHSQTYYWRVNASNDIGTGDWSTVWNFTTVIEQPDTPVLVSPTDGADDISTLPEFIWYESERVETYGLQVATDAVFDSASIVLDVETVEDTTYTVSEELDGFTTYYWRVNATNKGGTSEWSVTWEFETGEALPATPVLVSPENGAEQISVDTMLVWEESERAESYQLQLSTESDFSELVADSSGIIDRSFDVTGLEGLTTYYWRVRASNERGESEWSAVWNFTTYDVTSVDELAGGVPEEFRLEQNYPNPFNPVTTIRFAIPEAATVRLDVYNMLGQRIATLIDGELYSAGTYETVWDARDETGSEVSSGMYIYRISADEHVTMKKMLFMK